MDFIELPDGSLLNPQNVIRTVNHGQVQSIFYVNGTRDSLSDEEYEAIRKAVLPDKYRDAEKATKTKKKQP